MKKIIGFILKYKKYYILTLILLIFFIIELALFQMGTSTRQAFDIPQTGDPSIMAKNSKEFIEYEVKKGDTMKEIWKKNIIGYSYNNAVKLIIKANQLSNINNLKTGRIILIPIRIDGNSEIYIVKENDSLTEIVNRFKNNRSFDTMLNDLKIKNGEENLIDIEPGQTLLIP